MLQLPRSCRIWTNLIGIRSSCARLPLNDSFDDRSARATELLRKGTDVQSILAKPQAIELRVYAEDYFPDRKRVYSAPYTFWVLNAEQHAIWITEQLSRWHRQALDVRDRVLPASMGTPHPLYLGLVNSSPLPGAALADLLVSALNNNGGGGSTQGSFIRLASLMFRRRCQGLLIPAVTT